MKPFGVYLVGTYKRLGEVSAESAVFACALGSMRYDQPIGMLFAVPVERRREHVLRAMVARGVAWVRRRDGQTVGAT